MNESLTTPAGYHPVIVVPSGNDLYGEHHGLGISAIQFKMIPQNSSGTLIIENTFSNKGGPARHLHLFQDEWFYIVRGEFQFEIGQENFCLHPGDSVLGPRNVPHVWACASEGGGSILISFLPAGKMEAFFREVTKANAMPPQDPGLWRAHDMELLGPPLTV
jgi:quercetin dioxygenase-like cupin family protein